MGELHLELSGKSWNTSLTPWSRGWRSEDFLTQWEDFFDLEDRRELVALEQSLLVPLIQGESCSRKDLRPFTDFLATVRRKTPGL